MRIWQTAPNTAWSGWSSLGGSLSGDPVAAANTDGRLEVFARGADASLLRYTQSAPGSWA
ncbi:hypothetical protein [Nonomuraea sp. NPDC046570]|uniref:hypothetical protein n=1 Tax=Nonomuraea sp. NPDC046570 TaxID=3155255 RepID=UPI0033C4C164